MKKLHKLLLISLALAAISGIIISIGIAQGGREILRYKNIDDLERITETNSGMQEVSLELGEKTEFIVDMKHRDISILKSDDNKIHLRYSNQDFLSFSEEKDSFKIEENKFFRKHHYVNINGVKQLLLFGHVDYSSPYFELYLPDEQFSKLEVENESGSIKVEGVNAIRVELKQSYGDIEVKNSLFSEMKASCDVGDLVVEEIIVSNEMNLKGRTLEMIIYESEAKDFVLQNEVGDIHFRNLTVNHSLEAISKVGKIWGSIREDEKKFYNVMAESKIGDVDLDKSLNRKKRKTEEIISINLKSEVGDIELRSSEK